MAVKKVPLKFDWFRLGQTVYIEMKLNAQNIKLPNEPIFQ